jgi:hypothetical protein
MKYRKKPIIIDAIQWDGINFDEIIKFSQNSPNDVFTYGLSKETALESGNIFISTLEGVMTASKNDFIIRGINGEFYPCKPDIFEKTYESLNS